MSQKNQYDDIIIPTYIINLEERADRLSHIKAQFEGKNEFELNIVKAVKHEIGAIGLWQSITNIIRMATFRDEDVIIICEDDHEFIDYSKEYLLKNIIEAYEQGACLLSGGIGGFNQMLPVASNRWWVNAFWSTQFIVIYKRFFETILSEPFEDNDTADGKLSEMTSHKMVLYPFISVQKDFGYSDVTKSNNKNNENIKKLFENASSKIKKMAEAHCKYKELKLKISAKNNVANNQIP